MYGGSQRLVERTACGTETPVFHTDLTACDTYTCDAEAMVPMKCPSLVIVGEKGQTTPAKAGRHVTAGLTDSRVVGLPGGHAIIGECPDDTLDALTTSVRERDAIAA